jgi:hypothetical protein
MSNVRTVIRKVGGVWVAYVYVPDTCHIDTRNHKKVSTFPYQYHIYIEKAAGGGCDLASAPLEIITPYASSASNDHVTVRTYVIDGGDINEVDTDEIMVEDGAGGGGA